MYRIRTCPPGPELLEKLNVTAPLGTLCRLNKETHERACVVSSGVTSVEMLGGIGNESVCAHEVAVNVRVGICFREVTIRLSRQMSHDILHSNQKHSCT